MRGHQRLADRGCCDVQTGEVSAGEINEDSAVPERLDRVPLAKWRSHGTRCDASATVSTNCSRMRRSKSARTSVSICTTGLPYRVAIWAQTSSTASGEV